MRERFVDSSGVKIHVVEDGPEDGDPVVFLHGFPESWWCWRHQVKAVAEAGYRAVAMDLRGFGESDAPEDVAAYAIANSFGDVTAVIDSVGGRATLVSHDWGGTLGWVFAALMPDKVERTIVCNSPHPSAMADLTKNLAQLQASFYMYVYQFEGIAEELMSRNDYELMRVWWWGTASVKLPDEEVDRFVEMISRPGRLTAGINWYRANVHPSTYLSGQRLPLPPISSPVMLIWGLDDPYLTWELGRRAGEFVEGPFVLQSLPDTGHWVQQERPNEVSKLILEFLAANA